MQHYGNTMADGGGGAMADGSMTEAAGKTRASADDDGGDSSDGSASRGAGEGSGDGDESSHATASSPVSSAAAVAAAASAAAAATAAAAAAGSAVSRARSSSAAARTADRCADSAADQSADGTAARTAARTADSEAVPHWRGSMFVFDRRNTVRFGAEATAEPEAVRPIGKCEHCGVASEAFVNCFNIDCNRLHLVCPRCLVERRGFCCAKCTEAPRRRPIDLLAATDASGVLDFKAAIALTQGAPPGKADPNKLVNVKPPNVPRKDFNVDEHGTRAKQ